jgi:dTDP-4-amino-4,6-dideoxygalactose transaminase
MAAIGEVVDRSAFAGGPYVASFEDDFSKFCGVSHSVGLGNGTDALWLALLALGVGPGDEVITVPHTFLATAEAISYCGARPVFVDIDPRTYTMDPARIEQACQAHGAEYKGRKAGSIGHAGCFSFYPGKNLGAWGEAGAVTTNDAELAQRIRQYRDHGQSVKYHHSVIGWNARMDGIQGVVLRAKLRILAAGNAARRAHAALYDELLAGEPKVVRPLVGSQNVHVYHLYVVRVKNRDAVMQALGQRGVGTGIHYPRPVHLQAAYAHLGLGPGAFPVTESCAGEIVSLPMFPELKPEQVRTVAQELKAVLNAG